MARLIAICLVKHDAGMARPGEPFEGDESLIAAGVAMADTSQPEPEVPELEPEVPEPEEVAAERPARAARRASAASAP